MLHSAKFKALPKCYIRQISNIFQCAPEFRINRIADIPLAIAASSLSTLCLFEIVKAAKANGLKAL